MPSPEASRLNLEKAKAFWRPPRLWRSGEESRTIQRFVFQWLIRENANKPSARALARWLGISHTWVRKLAKKFLSNPAEMSEEARRYGDPTVLDLDLARKQTEEMREAGLLRSSSPLQKEKAGSGYVSPLLRNAQISEALKCIDRQYQNFVRRQVGPGGY